MAPRAGFRADIGAVFWAKNPIEFPPRYLGLHLPPFSLRDLEGRYAVAAETRNNLVAASQNISGAQRYLANVQFPYCAPPEVQTLNKVSSRKIVRKICHGHMDMFMAAFTQP